MTLWLARMVPCASVLITYVAVWASFQRSWSGVQPSSIFPKRLEVSGNNNRNKNSKKRSPLRGTWRVLAWREQRFSTEHSK